LRSRTGSAGPVGELVALAEHLRIEADALDQQVDPLIGRELLAGLQIAVEIKGRSG
jgi:hypothetical protein